MTDRDHFAAAALTGLLSYEANQYPTALQWEHLLKHAYRWADAMLRERERTDLDAAPAARARTDSAAGEPGGGHGSGGTDKPLTRPVLGTGNQTAPPCVETDGSSPATAQPPASSDGSGEGRPLDVTRPDNGEAAGGRGHNTQEPVAWLAHSDEWQMVSMHREHADAAAAENGAEVIPLYRTPQTCPYVVGRTTLHCSLTPFTLTDQERQVIFRAMYRVAGEDSKILWSLLERTR